MNASRIATTKRVYLSKIENYPPLLSIRDVKWGQMFEAEAKPSRPKPVGQGQDRGKLHEVEAKTEITDWSIKIKLYTARSHYFCITTTCMVYVRSPNVRNACSENERPKYIDEHMCSARSHDNSTLSTGAELAGTEKKQIMNAAMRRSSKIWQDAEYVIRLLDQNYSETDETL